MTVDNAAPEVSAFPAARTCPFDPAPEYGRLREEEPIARVRMPTGELVWLVTSYDYARQILTDARVSSDRATPGFPILTVFPSREVQTRVLERSLIGMDPPDHTVQRRMLIAEFTVKRLATLRPRITEIVGNCIDDLLAGPNPADLVESLALPIPTHVVCDLMDVPYEDRDIFQYRTKILVNRATPGPEKAAAAGELKAYVGELVARADADPGDNLLGRLAIKYREAGFNHDQLVRMMMLLLTGGHETTANMIALSTVALLRNPDQLAVIREDPALTRRAVEELLRYFSVAAEITCYRAALADIEIGGVHIRQGDGIVVLGSAANRDGAAFEDPDRLEIRRSARHHLAFGYGLHQCLGQNLARLELEIAINTLFERIPGLRLGVPFEELPFKHDSGIYGLYELPVTW